jgi:hypothetical protein
MTIRRMLCATILLFVVLLLAVNRAYANSIWVFAPGNYVGSLPSNPSPLTLALGGAGASVTPSTGFFSGSVSTISPFPWVHFMISWVYNKNVTQPGSVTSAAFMNYSITSASVGFYAELTVLRATGSGIFDWWQNVYHPYPIWQDGPGPFPQRTRPIDLEVTPNDKSLTGNYFTWIPGATYTIMFEMQAAQTGSGGAAWFNGYFKHFTLVFMQYSQSEDLVPANASIFLSPPFGPVGTNVQVNGTGFAPASPISITYDNASVANTTSDVSGNFTASFVVPSSTKGFHVVVATDGAGNQAAALFKVYIPSNPLVGDLNNDGKIDIKDISIVAKQFGKSDPNMLSTASTQVVTYSSITALATIGAVAPTAYVLGRKKNHSKRTSEKSTSET